MVPKFCRCRSWTVRYPFMSPWLATVARRPKSTSSSGGLGNRLVQMTRGILWDGLKTIIGKIWDLFCMSEIYLNKTKFRRAWASLVNSFISREWPLSYLSVPFHCPIVSLMIITVVGRRPAVSQISNQAAICNCSSAALWRSDNTRLEEPRIYEHPL